MNKFVIILGLAVFFVAVSNIQACSSTTSDTATTAAAAAATTSASGRKRRSLNSSSVAKITVLTTFKSDSFTDLENADEIEDELKELVAAKKLNLDQYGDAERVLSNDSGFLRITYLLERGNDYCTDLLNSGLKALQSVEDIQSGAVTCGNKTSAFSI